MTLLEILPGTHLRTVPDILADIPSKIHLEISTRIPLEMYLEFSSQIPSEIFSRIPPRIFLCISPRIPRINPVNSAGIALGIYVRFPF